jgi:hypothetical protein
MIQEASGKPILPLVCTAPSKAAFSVITVSTISHIPEKREKQRTSPQIT